MPPRIFEDVEIIGGSIALPLRTRQTAKPFPAVLRLVALSLVAGLIVLPQLGLAVHALCTPSIRSSLLADPIVALQLGLAMLFWIGIFLWPLKNLFLQLNAGRMVEIEAGTVTVTEVRPFSPPRRWCESLAGYRGVAHHIRSSLSGTCHEAVLVHRLPHRSVVLLGGQKAISEAEIASVSSLLHLPLISARELYPLAWFRKPNQRPRPFQLQPT